MPSSTFSETYPALMRTLVSARLAMEVTQVTLAERRGKPQSYVSKYERGERRIDVVEFCDIAEALGVSASDWFGEYLNQRMLQARRGIGSA